MYHRDLKAGSAEKADSCTVRSSQHTDSSTATSENVPGRRTGLVLRSGSVTRRTASLMRHNHIAVSEPGSTNNISGTSKGVSI